VLGAPEFVLRDAYLEYANQIETYSSQGYRVLVFAEYEGKLTGERLCDAAKAAFFSFTKQCDSKKVPWKTFSYFGKTRRGDKGYFRG